MGGVGRRAPLNGGGDLRRVLGGASLVLNEAAKLNLHSKGKQSGFRIGNDKEKNLETFLKRVVLSLTDLIGITSGTIHHHSSSKSNSPSSTLQYFSHHPAERQQQVRSADIIDKVDADSVSNELPAIEVSPVHANSDNQTPQLQKQHPRANLRRPRERRVPSTPIGRALGFAGLGAGLAWGTVQESARRVVYGSPPSNNNTNTPSSPFLSEKNAERLALALCRMRGAALKLGQMLSIQDESLVPAPILSALDIVRQGADVMPRTQLNNVLVAELGSDWTHNLISFDYEPLASASIGQVHRAVTKDNLVVAMKIQYPGVADSIDSDIENVRRLLDYSNILPKGLFLDRAIKVAKEELSLECDYELEARSQKRFRELLCTAKGVYVPLVIDDLSSKRVLTTEFVSGIPIDKVAVLNQQTRNYVGRKLLDLALKELFIFRFMQTDPNWSNFLYDENTKIINLIDFGAAREYSKSFVDDYLRMVLACANRDRDAVIEMSTRLGFLTGLEAKVMIDAHVEASFIVGLPFSASDAYDFRSSDITNSISHLGATMLKHRLTPPPDEAYSLHRKLSGAFLACIKLGAVVSCRDLLLQVYEQYSF